MIRFLSKKIILKTLLVIWMIFSIGYVGWNIWVNLKYSIANQAYQQGVTDAVNQVINTAQTNNCQPFPVFNKSTNKEVELINTSCLTKAK